MLSTLLAVADKVPNEQAVAIAPSIGWLMLTAAICVALIFIAYSDRWRSWWLTAEDPRGIAMFRIVFGIFVISNINGMWEFFEFLYTDEGIFTADVARHVFARGQFAGFGDGMTPDDPWGFFDIAGVWEFLKGPKYSLLFFWDSPTFFWAHLIAFEVAAICFVIGFRTRTMGVLTWFLMNSILTRNHLAWEGTELVYRCFLAYLILARSGHAFSVDNWLRVRKLRKQGKLSERDGDGKGAGVAPSDEHPDGLEPIYRLIPSWPRKLIMLQLCTIYITTGALKTGSVWMNGDSLYYALNLDHFYRVPPQYLSSLAGTSVFRAMTYAVKVGQMSFPLIMVGLITRYMIREGFGPLEGVRKWAARLSFAGLIGATAGIIFLAWPVHFTPKITAGAAAGIWVGLWAALWLLWRKLGNNPFVIKKIGRRELENPLVIDKMFVCRWFLGRRVFLVWHLAFHAHIFTLMNVGQFQTGMASATFAFLKGREIGTMLRDIGNRLARIRFLRPLIPDWVVNAEPVTPAADPNLPQYHRDSSLLPRWVLLLGLGGVVAGILVKVRFSPEWDWRWVWVATVVALAGIAFAFARKYGKKNLSAEDPTTGRPRTPWAYGPFGRFVIGLGVAWQLTAVATWLMPDKDCLSTFRPQARKVFVKWLTVTTTDQGWGMFAPNPPRSNVFMKVLVTDQNGEVYDLKTDVYAEEQKPQPWIWNTRLRKMNRRIIGGESGPTAWYQKWYARYECREWARQHEGVVPKKVELIKVWYRIPSPEQTHKKGYYVAEELLDRAGAEKVSYTEHCQRGVMSQLPNFIRERDGLPLLDNKGPERYRPWIKHKKRAWESKKKREAEKAAKEKAAKAKKD